jgi:C1A family cysteine protease
MYQTKRYGWLPDLPDRRDLAFLPPVTSAHVPESVDLRPDMPLPPFDQADLGSCVANSLIGAVVFDQAKQKLPVQMMSRLFVYYFGRQIEHTIGEDAGLMIRDGIKAYNRFGVCPETDWPYDIDRFTDRPDASDVAEATAHRPLHYRRVTQSTLGVKRALALGYPVIFGFTVYESFESEAVANTGRVPMPDPSEDLLGGHAVLAIGYTSEHVIVRNSWGGNWGDGGYFYMPWAYLLDRNLADDLWLIDSIRG